MDEPVLTARQALAWVKATNESWRRLVSSQPQILTISCDINGTSNVAELLQHIVAVELRYAQRILGQPETSYAEIPFDSADAIYSTHDRAMRLYEQALDGETDWTAPIEFLTRTGAHLLASRKAILFHAAFHTARHYAQLATLARPHGYKADRPGDYLFMEATPAPKR
jgi:uncharacterized damage-inducible protein DinB